MSKYTEHSKLPAWYTYIKDKAPATEGYAWSGAQGPPPVIGDQIVVTMNGIGPATVIGYFTESGFLGLLVKPSAPPAWYVKQNGKNATGHIFGTEFKKIDPVKAALHFLLADAENVATGYGMPVEDADHPLHASVMRARAVLAQGASS